MSSLILKFCRLGYILKQSNSSSCCKSFLGCSSKKLGIFVIPNTIWFVGFLPTLKITVQCFFISYVTLMCCITMHVKFINLEVQYFFSMLWWYHNGRALSKGHLFIILTTSQLNLKSLWIKTYLILHEISSCCFCCLRWPCISY